MIEGRKEEKALHWNEKDNKYRIKSAKLQNCKDNSPTVKSKYNYFSGSGNKFFSYTIGSLHTY